MTRVEPLFLRGTAGFLFALHVRTESPGDRGVVLLPPFAEEMNRARRMLRLQATALAEAGITALLLDPFGTGDSAGDFADAGWETWVADVRIAADALITRGCGRVGLLGLRLGATLAAAAAPTLASPCFATVFLQPVVRGRSHLTEFLRVRTMPGALNRDGPMTLEMIRDRLAAGKTVEAAGYDVTPRLAAALDALELATLAHPALGRVTWLELVLDPGLPLSAAGARCADAWMAGGLAVTTGAIPGPAFWIKPDNAVVPDLIAATVTAFEAAR